MSRFKYLILLIAITLTFSGCLVSKKIYRIEPMVVDDEFAGLTTINGMELLIDQENADKAELVNNMVKWYNYTYLRSFIATKGNVQVITNQLYVEVRYLYVWRFYNSAIDEFQNNLVFKSLDRNYSDSSFGEIFAITIPLKQLKDCKDSGFNIRIYSKKGGNLTLKVTSEQITKQLESVASKSKGNILDASEVKTKIKHIFESH